MKTTFKKGGKTKRVADSEEPIITIPPIVKVVDVQVTLVRVAPKFGHIAIAIGIDPHRKYTKYHLYHHPSNTLRIEFYSASLLCLNILCQVSSFFTNQE
jgi:hypothetical protein